jgi:hypothetical protein
MSNNTCLYVLKKGKNKGTCCGTKCNNNTYCKKHLVDELNTEPNDNDNNDNDDNKVDINKEVKAINNVNEKKPKVSKEPKVPKEPKESKKSKEPKLSKEPKNNEKKNVILDTSMKVNVYNKCKLQAKRNKHNNYVLENNMVVHPVNKLIIGKQHGEKVIELSIEDIDYCKEHSLRYEPPSVMYFNDSENEKKEVELYKYIIKSKNNENNNKENEEYEDNIEDDDEDNIEEDNEDNEDND